MREDSRRGAPRQASGAGRAGTGRGARGPGPGGRGSDGYGSGGRGSGGRGGGQGGSRSGPDAVRPGPGSRGAVPGTADTARLTGLIEPVLRAMDIDLEAVRITAAGRRRVLKIIVDADGGISLDDIAEVSREVSARLDAKDAMGDAPYTLEVSSPGVDRPLTQPRHWRRAVGRLVIVPIANGGQPAQRDVSAAPAEQEARVMGADDGGVLLQIGGERRTVSYRDLGPGRVQVEFGHFDDASDVEDEEGFVVGEVGESWDGPDEEGPDGH